MDYKNLMGFLIIKELNQRQVRQVEILIEYYFEIQHTKGTNNTRADVLSRKTKLQNSKKLLGALLRLEHDGLIQYNYPKLVATYKLLESNQI